MKLISDVKGERKIAIELSERELAYIICTMNMADEFDVKNEAVNEQMEILNIMEDEEVDLLEKLEDIYRSGR